MLISLDRTGTVESLAALMADTTAHPGVAGLMVLACDANGFSPEKLDSLLQGSPLPVFGGIFPQIIHGCDHLERGTLVIGLPVAPRLSVITGLSYPETDFDAGMSVIDDCGSTVFVFVDGLARRIGALTTALFENFGLLPNYVGGGAGCHPAAAAIDDHCVDPRCADPRQLVGLVRHRVAVAAALAGAGRGRVGRLGRAFWRRRKMSGFGGAEK